MYTGAEIIYKSDFNINKELILGGLIILLVFIVIFTISLWHILKKANKKKTISLIPIYNLITFLEVLCLPKWQTILFLIPGINIFYLIFIWYTLVKVFKKESNYFYKLLFFPFFYLLKLALDDSKYVGIDLEAFNVVDIDPNAMVEDIKLPESVVEDLNKYKHIELSVGSISNKYKNKEIREKLMAEAKKEKGNSFIKLEEKQDLGSGNTEYVSEDVIKHFNPVIEEKKEEETVCPKCGIKLKKDVKVCFLCGTKIE